MLYNQKDSRNDPVQRELSDMNVGLNSILIKEEELIHLYTLNLDALHLDALHFKEEVHKSICKLLVLVLHVPYLFLILHNIFRRRN